MEKTIKEVESEFICELYKTFISIPKENAIPIDVELYVEIAKILAQYLY